MPWGNRQELRSPGHGTNAHEDEAFPDTAPCLIRTIPSRSMVLESTIGKCMAKSLSTKVAVEPTIPHNTYNPPAQDCWVSWFVVVWESVSVFLHGTWICGFFDVFGTHNQECLDHLITTDDVFRCLLYSIEILMRRTLSPQQFKKNWSSESSACGRFYQIDSGAFGTLMNIDSG